MKKLTDTAIRAALARRGSRRIDLADSAVSGLVLRIGRKRGATWSLRFRVVGEGGVSNRGHALRGDKHRVSLGSYPEVSLEAARAKANLCLDQARRGETPIAELERAATARGMTVRALADRFMADYVRMKQLRAEWRYETSLRVHVFPVVGEVLADILTREQVRAMVKQAMIRERPVRGRRGRPIGGVEAARNAIVALRKMMNWGIREGLLKRTDNPVLGMEDNLPRRKSRERVLSVEEARVAWQAAQTLGYPYGPMYQLLLLTGCRPGEWETCQRSYVDLKQALLVIPASAYKTDHVHVVPLVAQAVAILEHVLTQHRGRSGQYIFSGTDGKKPVDGCHNAQDRMERAICAVTGERPAVRWTPHDLRRTVATRIAENLGVGGEQLIKRVLGHSVGGVTAIYNRYGYVREMRTALERWAADLTGTPVELGINDQVQDSGAASAEQPNFAA